MPAYVDSSCLIAIGFGESGAAAIEKRLRSFDALMASNLLEAELRAAFRRESIVPETDVLDRIEWIFPERSLSPELGQVFAAGYLKGADAWHVACALHVAGSYRDLAFLTLDTRQRDVAAQLGFPTP